MRGFAPGREVRAPRGGGATTGVAGGRSAGPAPPRPTARRRKRSRRPAPALVAIGSLVLLSSLFPGSVGIARAQEAAEEEEHPFSLKLGGYARSLTALHDAAFALPGAERRTGFNTEVVRLTWSARWRERIVLQVHNRLQAQVSSATTGPGGSVAGLGVSIVPGRSLDLSTTLLDEDRIRVWHDIDRLAVAFDAGRADVTVGRQAITWGLASLFPVADLWAQFSPFELDTEEKPGIDAVRVLAYPAEGVEVDAVLADRGSPEDLSAGIRATIGLASADVYAAIGKFWDEAIALGGIALVLDRTTLRAEAALPWDLEGGGPDLPRATLGIDWLSPRLALSGEYHFNGIGAPDAEGYAARLLDDPRFGRGESYFLGRHYVGGVAAWTPGEDGRLSLTLSALANLGDPSAALTPLLAYDLGQSARIAGGTLQSLGKAPSLAPPFGPRSEFGTYGDLWFTYVSVYF